MAQLPEGTRLRAFAATELFLDLVYTARKLVDFDLESVLIYYCASEATMRPMVLGEPAQKAHVALVHPPSEARGWISRRGLADRTGLARETVRRKAQALIERGLLEEDAKGHVRATPMLHTEQVRAMLQEVEEIVRRHQSRLAGGE